MADETLQTQTVTRVLTGALAGATGRYGGVMFTDGQAVIPADAHQLDTNLRRYYGAKAPDESDEDAQAKLGPSGDAARVSDYEARQGISYHHDSFDAGAQHAHDAGTQQASGRAPKGDAMPGTIQANQAAIDAAKADKTAIAHPAARIDPTGTTATDAGTDAKAKGAKAVKAEDKAHKAQTEQAEADAKAAQDEADKSQAKDDAGGKGAKGK